MLQGINKIGRSWVGRIVVTILFGFLIVSFAVWGIGDIFRGGTRTQVATVGKTDITADAFRNAYQTEYQGLLRQFRQTLTPEQARALGLDQRVLAKLISEAAFDQKARDFGLSISDALVVDATQTQPAFSGPNGQFDRNRFVEILRENGLSEAQFIRMQRSTMARAQLAEAVTGDLPVPLATREAVHRYRNERRTAEYVTLSPSVLGNVPAPTAEQLQAFFDERKATYRAPEYRALTLLAISPDALAKPEAISDAEARAIYEQVKTTRFGTAEKRSVQQIIFPSKGEADAASDRIRNGTAFDEIARERGVDPTALELGTLARTEMLDPAIASAAFGLPEGAVSAPVDGRFGPVLVRVTRIEAGTAKPFEEVAPETKRDAARDRARNEIQSLHDAIEDERAGAKSLADIAKAHGLSPVLVDATDRMGLGSNGQPVALPGDKALLTAAFRSDIGADNEPIGTPDGGYVWFDVNRVQPARDRTLDEAKDRVAADWRAEDISRGLADKAREVNARLDLGEELSVVARELGLQVAKATDLARGSASGDLSADIVTRIFATPVGKAASAAAAGSERRVVFRVTDAVVPAFVTTTQEAASTETQLRTAISDDLIAEFVAEIEKSVGVQVYPESVRRAIGGES